MKKQIVNYSKFPDERESGKTQTEQIQLVLNRMLKIFDHICQKHEIDYWLDYGTLLGAIRHQGFIPWDCDLDVGMLRSDYIQFIEKGVQDLPQDIFFQNRDTDPTITPYTPYVEARLRDKYSSLTYAYTNGHYDKITWHNGINFDFFIYDWDPVYPETISNSYERLLNASKVHIKKEEIEYLDTAMFMGQSYPIPAGYDPYLERCYPDYMQLPPVAERIPANISPFIPCDHPESLQWEKRHLHE